jgi:hypothetical protein
MANATDAKIDEAELCVLTLLNGNGTHYEARFDPSAYRDLLASDSSEMGFRLKKWETVTLEECNNLDIPGQLLGCFYPVHDDGRRSPKFVSFKEVLDWTRENVEAATDDLAPETRYDLLNTVAVREVLCSKYILAAVLLSLVREGILEMEEVVDD